MLIEAAYQDGKFIGHRLREGPDTLLVFANQPMMQGFRLAEKFVPSIGTEIEYRKCKVVENTPPISTEL